MSINKVILIGNLARDPEVKYTSTGNCVCNITVATSHFSKSGADKTEETEFNRVVLFGKQAEIAGKYTLKGKSVYIEGRLKTRKFKDNSGNDRYYTEIIAEDIQLMGKKSDEYTPEQSSVKPKETKQDVQQSTKPDNFSIDSYPDDIPF